MKTYQIEELDIPQDMQSLIRGPYEGVPSQICLQETPPPGSQIIWSKCIYNVVDVFYDVVAVEDYRASKENYDQAYVTSSGVTLSVRFAGLD